MKVKYIMSDVNIVKRKYEKRKPFEFTEERKKVLEEVNKNKKGMPKKVKEGTNSISQDVKDSDKDKDKEYITDEEDTPIMIKNYGNDPNKAVHMKVYKVKEPGLSPLRGQKKYADEILNLSNRDFIKVCKERGFCDKSINGMLKMCEEDRMMIDYEERIKNGEISESESEEPKMTYNEYREFRIKQRDEAERKPLASGRKSRAIERKPGVAKPKKQLERKAQVKPSVEQKLNNFPRLEFL